jgi:NO-binding membrane sensor protein with MHYT domain/signal transduction histidine kinase
MITVLNCVTTEHDLRLVLLAAVACLIGVGAAVRLLVHARDSEGGVGLAWLGLSGGVTGASVWATHFIAMLGYRPDQGSSYELFGTIASLLVAVCGAIGAFAILHLRRGRVSEVASGVALGGIIAAVHYSGMAAVQTNGVIIWDPVLIGASVLMAGTLAPLAFLVLGESRTWRRSIAAMALLVLAICSLHFTGMAAVTILPLAAEADQVAAINPGLLAAMVAGVVSVVISASLLVAALDRWHRASAGERLTEALEAMTDGLAYFDEQDRLMIWNAQYQRTCPDVAALLVRGMTFEQILRLELDRGVYSEAVGREADWLAERLQVRHGGSDAFEQEMSDGRWLRVQDRRSSLGGTVSTIVDVTTMKIAAAGLERARDAAEQANRAKSEFLANMSHEIRTPLNGILGVAEVLGKTALSREQADMLKLISASGTTLQQLLSDILDIARVESGRLTLSEAPFDLAQAVREAGQLYQAPARDKGLQFFVDIADDAQVWATGDVVRIKQVLTNLVSNAVKFTETGFVRLTVKRAADRRGQAVFASPSRTRVSVLTPRRETGCSPASNREPLPDLGAADLGGRGILHQVVDRHRAAAAQPGLDVLHCRRGHSREAPSVRVPSCGFSSIAGSIRHVLTLLASWFGQRHQAVEHLHRHRHQVRMRDPGAVMAVAGLALLVGLDLGEGGLVGGRIVLDRDLRRHAAHGEGAARWQVLISSANRRRKALSITTCARSGRT